MIDGQEPEMIGVKLVFGVSVTRLGGGVIHFSIIAEKLPNEHRLFPFCWLICKLVRLLFIRT